jgi:hypothetical protein
MSLNDNYIKHCKCNGKKIVLYDLYENIFEPKSDYDVAVFDELHLLNHFQHAGNRRTPLGFDIDSMTPSGVKVRNSFLNEDGSAKPYNYIEFLFASNYMVTRVESCLVEKKPIYEIDFELKHSFGEKPAKVFLYSTEQLEKKCSKSRKNPWSDTRKNPWARKNSASNKSKSKRPRSASKTPRNKKRIRSPSSTSSRKNKR